MADDDPRYLECRHCGTRDKIQVGVTLNAAVGDGVPWVDTSRIVDTHEWECLHCGSIETNRTELCFIGYPGITEDEKEEQRHE